MTTRTSLAAFVLAAVFLIAAHASAQEHFAVTLTPESPTRWDVAGQVGWLGANKAAIVGTGWNDWSDAAAFTASGGFYWTRHLKAEVEVTTTTQSELFSYENLTVPGDFYPFPRARTHFFRSTSMSGGLSYQFFENAWFHPFVGAGVEVQREWTRTALPQQFIPSRDGRPSVLMPGEATDWDATASGRPFAAAGFKWYVAERAFIRSDLRATFSPQGGESVLWRAGVGVDF